MATPVPGKASAPRSGLWTVIGRLAREAGARHARGYALALSFMIAIAGTTAASAWIVRDVVNQVFVDRDTGELIGLAFAVVVISALRGLSLYGSIVTLSRVANAITA
ncbi:MAG TPA: ABC transporter ATP-binding protein, partial [Bauldia sp.]|nr:ABC transporter ATP-binding protein [Bauldia sp.]